MTFQKKASKSAQPEPVAGRKVRCVATKLGWDGTRRIQKGARVVWLLKTGDQLPSWLILEEDAIRAAKEAEDAELDGDEIDLERPTGGQSQSVL